MNFRLAVQCRLEKVCVETFQTLPSSDWQKKQWFDKWKSKNKPTKRTRDKKKTLSFLFYPSTPIHSVYGVYVYAEIKSTMIESEKNKQITRNEKKPVNKKQKCKQQQKWKLEYIEQCNVFFFIILNKM